MWFQKAAASDGGRYNGKTKTKKITRFASPRSGQAQSDEVRRRPISGRLASGIANIFHRLGSGLSSAVADVKNGYSSVSLIDGVNNSVGALLIAKEQMAESLVFRNDSAALRMLL
jgi:hypothetical protein